MTTCRPAAMQASAWRTPATGSPVASTTTSGSPWPSTLSASGNKPSAAISASLQPDRRSVACARSGARSHTPRPASPGWCAPAPGTWTRTCPRRSQRRAPDPRRVLSGVDTCRDYDRCGPNMSTPVRVMERTPRPTAGPSKQPERRSARDRGAETPPRRGAPVKPAEEARPDGPSRPLPGLRLPIDRRQNVCGDKLVRSPHTPCQALPIAVT